MTGFKTNTFFLFKNRTQIPVALLWLWRLTKQIYHMTVCLSHHALFSAVINDHMDEFTSMGQQQVSRLWCVCEHVQMHTEMLPYTQSLWVFWLISCWQPCCYFALCYMQVVCLYTTNAANDPWPPFLTAALEIQTNKKIRDISTLTKRQSVGLLSVSNYQVCSKKVKG